MDVTDDSSVKNAINAILAEAGNIDILINNAGIMYWELPKHSVLSKQNFKWKPIILVLLE
jgi:NADP-dependent 3-hydroxy acid dehydrogenase YdfG